MGESTGKKRKSTTDRSPDSKRKKVGSQPQGPTEVQIASIVKPQSSPPVIVTTPGVELSKSIQFHPYAKESSGQRRKKNAAAPELLLHSASHRSLDYTAREDGPNGAESLLKHYVGVFDPQTGKLDVVEAKKMVVRGVVRSQKAAEGSMSQRDAKQSHFDMKTELGEAFGTKKAKKAIRSVAENAISDTTLGAGELAVVNTINTSAKHMATQEELQAVIDQARPVPRANLDAQEIHDVYRPADIIGAEVLKAIPVLDWQESANKNEPVSVSSQFVANRIARVAALENSVQRLKVLRYLNSVLIFWKSTQPGRVRGTKNAGQRDILRERMAPVPDTVIDNIRRKFSDMGIMRKTHVDLLMTHCCAFASIIDNFECNTLDLREDLKLEQKEVNQYFKEIGARIKQQKNGDNVVHIAKLSLPLEFPKVRQARRT